MSSPATRDLAENARSRRPRNDLELWEYVHRLFGIGDWVEDSGLPWWQYRQHEVMKVKRKRIKQQVEVTELADCADYCKAHRIDIRNVAWLYQYLGPSRSWHAERERALTSAEFDEIYAGAVEEALAAGDEDWAGRLIRARGESRQEVIAQWQAAHR